MLKFIIIGLVITLFLIVPALLTKKPIEETDLLDDDSETEYSDAVKLVPRDTQPTITKTIPT